MEKTCTVCHESKPLGSFYRARTKDGYAGVCRACIRSRPRDARSRTEKRCPRCGEVKPLAEFHKNAHRADGVQQYCAPCTREFANNYYAEKAHDLLISKTYGLERGEYAKMLATQGGVCAICREPETAVFRGRPKKLALDHDHADGHVRALLCNKCNTILGRADDDLDLLRACIAYVELHKLAPRKPPAVAQRITLWESRPKWVRRPPQPPAMEGVKTCSRCGETKAVTEFHAARDYADGRAYACAACENKRKERRRAEHPVEAQASRDREHAKRRASRAARKAAAQSS